MFVTPLSPVLEESLESRGSEITVLHVKDNAILKDFLNEKVIKTLMASETCLIVVPDSYDLTSPAKILSVNKLAHLCILWNDEEPLSERQIERFRILNKLKPTEYRSTDLDEKLVRQREIRSRLKSIFTSINHSQLDSESLKSLLNKRNPDVIQYFSHHISDLSSLIDIKHLADIDDLKELESSYHERFEYIEEAFQLDDKIFKSSESLAQAKEELNKLYEQSEMLLKSAGDQIQRFFYSIRSATESEYHTWVRLSGELQDLYHESDSKKGRVSFDRDSKVILAELNKSQYLNSNSIDIKEASWDKMPDILKRLKVQANQCKKVFTTNGVRRNQPRQLN